MFLILSLSTVFISMIFFVFSSSSFSYSLCSLTNCLTQFFFFIITCAWHNIEKQQNKKEKFFWTIFLMKKSLRTLKSNGNFSCKITLNIHLNIVTHNKSVISLLWMVRIRTLFNERRVSYIGRKKEEEGNYHYVSPLLCVVIIYLKHALTIH